MAATPQTITAPLEIIPDPMVPKFRILVQRDAKTGAMGIYRSEDGGLNYVPLIPCPTPKNKPGHILTLNDALQAYWAAPVTQEASSALIQAQNQTRFVDISCAGEVSQGDGFGYFRVPTGKTFKLTEIQYFLKTPSTAPIQIDFLKQHSLLGRAFMISPGMSGSLPFSSPILMASGTIWSFQITSTGGTLGENLTLRLVLEPTA